MWKKKSEVKKKEKKIFEQRELCEREGRMMMEEWNRKRQKKKERIVGERKMEMENKEKKREKGKERKRV